MATILSGEKNARGIPYVAFIDSVEGTLATTTDGTVEAAAGAMNELHQKFKILEGHKARTKASMKLKIPEIKRTLQLVRHIKEKHEASEDFGAHSLSEMLYGRAKVTPTGPCASGSARTSWSSTPTMRHDLGVMLELSLSGSGVCGATSLRFLRQILDMVHATRSSPSSASRAPRSPRVRRRQAKGEVNHA